MSKDLWLCKPAATTHRGDNTARLNGTSSWWKPLLLSEARDVTGSGFLQPGSQVTVNGPTNGLEVTDGTAGADPALEWISEPLSADFTISGTITANLWSLENDMNSNASINFIVEKIDGATGALTQIVKSVRTTELGTSIAAANFTATPTSTACKRGDRLRVRVFGADGPTMVLSAVGSVFFGYGGLIAAGTGDSWIRFTENLTFEPAGDPTGSTYYLTDTAESINPGAATEKKALTTRGSGSVTAVTNTAAGPTAPIQVTASGGGTAVEWYTPALEAVTFGGKAKVNLRGLESSAAANASLCVQIAVCNGDGSSPVVWGKANIQSDNTSGGEIGTFDAAYTAWVSGDDVAITAGQRLRFRIYIEDPAVGPLVTGNTVTVTYNGATAAAAGDTYMMLPVAVVEQGAGGTAHTHTPADTLTLADALERLCTSVRTPADTVALADSVKQRNVIPSVFMRSLELRL